MRTEDQASITVAALTPSNIATIMVSHVSAADCVQPYKVFKFSKSIPADHFVVPGIAWGRPLAEVAGGPTAREHVQILYRCTHMIGSGWHSLITRSPRLRPARYAPSPARLNPGSGQMFRYRKELGGYSARSSVESSACLRTSWVASSERSGG